MKQQITTMLRLLLLLMNNLINILYLQLFSWLKSKTIKGVTVLYSVGTVVIENPEPEKANTIKKYIFTSMQFSYDYVLHPIWDVCSTTAGIVGGTTMIGAVLFVPKSAAKFLASFYTQITTEGHFVNPEGLLSLAVIAVITTVVINKTYNFFSKFLTESEPINSTKVITPETVPNNIIEFCWWEPYIPLLSYGIVIAVALSIMFFVVNKST